MTLEDLLRKKDSLDIKAFLKINIGISNIVELINQVHIINKSLQPQNILLTDKVDAVKVTLFHQSTQLSSETQHPNESPFQLKERVAYM